MTGYIEETLGGLIFYEFNRSELEQTKRGLGPTGALEAVQSFSMLKYLNKYTETRRHIISFIDHLLG